MLSHLSIVRPVVFSRLIILPVWIGPLNPLTNSLHVAFDQVFPGNWQFLSVRARLDDMGWVEAKGNLNRRMSMKRNLRIYFFESLGCRWLEPLSLSPPWWPQVGWWTNWDGEIWYTVAVVYRWVRHFEILVRNLNLVVYTMHDSHIHILSFIILEYICKCMFFFTRNTSQHCT